MAEPLIEPDMMKRLEQLMLVSRKMSAGTVKGERRSRHRGMSTDFADYRNYVPGDDTRFLDWKIYGRLEKLFLKLYLEEEELTVHVLLDTSASMKQGDPEKLLYGKRIAAALGYMTLSKMDRLFAYGFSEGLTDRFGPKRGKANAARYFDWLSNLEVGQTTSLLDSMKTFSNAGRKGLAVVISDFYDFQGYQAALKQLFSRNYEVFAVHLLSPQELNPDHQGDLRLVDCEFGLATDVSMGKSVTDLYQQTLTAFCDGIKDYLVSRGGTYLPASTEMPFDRLVLDLLRRKGMAR